MVEILLSAGLAIAVIFAWAHFDKKHMRAWSKTLPFVDARIDRRKGGRLQARIDVRNRWKVPITIDRVEVEQPDGAAISVGKPLEAPAMQALDSVADCKITISPANFLSRNNESNGQPDGGSTTDRRTIGVSIRLPTKEWAGLLDLFLRIVADYSTLEPRAWLVHAKIDVEQKSQE